MAPHRMALPPSAMHPHGLQKEGRWLLMAEALVPALPQLLMAAVWPLRVRNSRPARVAPLVQGPMKLRCQRQAQQVQLVQMASGRGEMTAAAAVAVAVAAGRLRWRRSASSS